MKQLATIPETISTVRAFLNDTAPEDMEGEPLADILYDLNSICDGQITEVGLIVALCDISKRHVDGGITFLVGGSPFMLSLDGHFVARA